MTVCPDENGTALLGLAQLLDLMIWQGVLGTENGKAVWGNAYLKVWEGPYKKAEPDNEFLLGHFGLGWPSTYLISFYRKEWQIQCYEIIIFIIVIII